MEVHHTIRALESSRHLRLRPNAQIFRLHVSLPVGVAATVRLPLGGRAAGSVNVFESGQLIWAAGSYEHGVATGVYTAIPWADVTGSGVEIQVGSGEYSFTAELNGTR